MSPTAGALVTGLCFWQAYTFNSAVPSKAVLGGLNIHANGESTKGRGVDFAYIARAQEGDRTGLFRVYTRRKATIGFTWDSPLTSFKYSRYDGSSRKRGEILVCDTRYSDSMRWVSYKEDTVDLDRCVQLGINKSSGEPIFVARVTAYVENDPDRGRIPAIYMPDLGLAIAHFGDFHVHNEFELLCQD